MLLVARRRVVVKLNEDTGKACNVNRNVTYYSSKQIPVDYFSRLNNMKKICSNNDCYERQIVE